MARISVGWCFSMVLATGAMLVTLGAAGDAASQASVAPRPAPVSPVPPLLNRQQVDRALGRLDGVIEAAMEKTGVPGVAVAVVYDGKVVHAKGFGVRETGEPGLIDTDTVFLLASVSKPIASTIIASLVGRGLLDWDDPVKRHNPEFALSDPYVTEHASIADLLSHRSGLATGAGDLLEDLGYDRDYILGHLDRQPLDTFRSTYHYSNFGYTAGGEAAAVAAGKSWEDLADEVLFQPLGMTRSSYRHADYMRHENRARIHVPVGDPADRVWRSKYQRNADAEAPAGGASASINDLAQFIRLQLGEGRFEGKTIIDAKVLAATHAPHQVSDPPRTSKARAGFYGLGWGVGYDDLGRVRLSHSGAFYLGASTYVVLLPGEDLGIAVLSNGSPVGLPEAVAATFFDIARTGEQTVDWLGFFGRIFRQVMESQSAGFDNANRPANARPARVPVAYVGTYENAYYGQLVVRADGGRLSVTLGPDAAPTTWEIAPFDGDTFTFETTGENATGRTGVTFVIGSNGMASSATLVHYNKSGLGTFTRN